MVYLQIRIKRNDRLDEASYGNPSFDIEESTCGRQHYQPSPLIPITIHETTSYLPTNHVLTLDTDHERRRSQPCHMVAAVPATDRAPRKQIVRTSRDL